MSEFKANKSGRRPFPAGTLVDVIIREGKTYNPTVCVSQRILEGGEYAGHLEVIGAVVSPEGYATPGIHDWKIENTLGDVLAYRKHEGGTNEQG